MIALLWLISLCVFIFYWWKERNAKKSAGEDYETDPIYNNISNMKRKIGFACIGLFVLAIMTSDSKPKSEQPVQSSNPPAVENTKISVPVPNFEIKAGDFINNFNQYASTIGVSIDSDGSTMQSGESKTVFKFQPKVFGNPVNFAFILLSCEPETLLIQEVSVLSAAQNTTQKSLTGMIYACVMDTITPSITEEQVNSIFNSLEIGYNPNDPISTSESYQRSCAVGNVKYSISCNPSIPVPILLSLSPNQ